MPHANLLNLSVAEIDIIYRNRINPDEMRKITNSQDAHKVFRDIWSDQTDHIEEFNMIMLNKANRVLCFTNISRGGVSGTVVDPKVIFQAALKSNASSIIVAHNHPSGNNRPSEADIRITKKIKESGILLDISLLDALILAGDGYYSFADDGAL